MSWRRDCVRITSAALPAVLPFSTRIDRDEITPKILATPLPDTRYLGATPTRSRMHKVAPILAAISGDCNSAPYPCFVAV